MQDLNDLRFLVEVVEQNGFAAAARKLGMPRSRLQSADRDSGRTT